MSPEAAIRDWARVLDELEDDLELVGASLEAHEPAPETDWQPPTDLGPPPQEIQPRLRALLLRIAALQGQAQQRMTELGGELHGVDRRRTAGAAYGAEAVYRP